MEQWREKLKSSIRTIDDLKRRAKLDGGEEKRLSEAIHTFPMQITPYYFNLINWEDPDDPLKKIVIPSVEELSAEGSLDTSKENEITILPGIQHKYVSTVLLLASDVCASHCRFCFRRRLKMDGSSAEVLKSPEQLEKALAYIKNHREVDNVLITGGDPLMLTNRRLDSILEGLRKIEHVKIIRIGTRTPAYLPQRITEDVEFRNIISKHNREDSRIYFIVHFDHPRELTKEAIRALKLLIEEGAILRNQTVLLKGVNDKPEIIRELFNKLSYVGVTPYYLFQDRPVKGGKYFQVPLKESYRIFEQAKKGMTGLAKTASYIISHSTGKIAIVGIDDDRIYLKYHQAKNPEDTGKFFSLKLEEDTYWFDDLVA
jgi:KamA family protein